MRKKIQELKKIMLDNIEVLENSILFLFEQQTADEQDSEDTIESNGVGFNSFDAKIGTYFANWIKSGKHLSGVHLSKAQKMMPKYARQIVSLRENAIQSKDKEECCPKCGKRLVHPEDWGDYDDAIEWGCSGCVDKNHNDDYWDNYWNLGNNYDVPCGSKDNCVCGGLNYLGTKCYECSFYDTKLDGRLGDDR